MTDLFREKYRIDSARFHDWDYRSRGWYFVTICAHNRMHLFGDVVNDEVRLSEIGQIASFDLQDLHQHYYNVQVDEYVVMPNHVHAIISIDGEHGYSPRSNDVIREAVVLGCVSPRTGSLSAIIRSYKAGVTQKSRKLGFTGVIWQSRFHDHLLRGDKIISAVREYIRNNPVNWRLDTENCVDKVPANEDERRTRDVASNVSTIVGR